MRIVIEIPDELLATTAVVSPAAQTDDGTTSAAGTVTAAMSGGAAPDTARAMAQSRAAIGMDALPAGAAEAAATPAVTGPAIGDVQNGGPAPG